MLPVLVPFDFHCMDKKKKHTDIFQNIFFYVPQKIKSYTGLEQLEGDKMMKQVSFLGKLSL